MKSKTSITPSQLFAEKLSAFNAIFVLVAILLSGPATFAQETAWQSTGGNNWGTSGNWTNGVPDTAGEFVISPTQVGTANVNGNYTFGGIGNATTPVNIGTNWSIQGSSGSNSLSMGVFNKAGSATLTVSNSATGNLTVNVSGDLLVSGGMTFGSAGNGLLGLTVGGTSTINGTTNLNVTSTANMGILSMGSSGILNIANFTSPDTLRTVTTGGITGTSGTIRAANSGSAAGTSHAHIIESNVASGSYSYSGTIVNGTTAGSTVTFRKEGAGTQNLAGNNTYSGGTTLNNGTLQVGFNSFGTVSSITSSAVGTGGLVLNGGTLSSNGTVARTLLNAVTVGGNVTLGNATNSGTLTFSGNMSLGGGTRSLTVSSAVTVDGVISNGALTKAGSAALTLGGNNTYTGATTISAGTLLLSSAGSIATSSGISIGSGATYNVSSVSGYALASGQTLSGNGTVVGNLSVGSGTLAIGSSPGTMTFNNDLSFTSLSTANFEINAFTSGNYDLALGGAGTQAVNFAGTLNVAFQSGFATEGFVKIFDFENYSTNFSTINFSGLASGYSASFNQLNGTVTVIPEPGTALLVGAGAALLAMSRMRRRSAR